MLISHLLLIVLLCFFSSFCVLCFSFFCKSVFHCLSLTRCSPEPYTLFLRSSLIPFHSVGATALLCTFSVISYSLSPFCSLPTCWDTWKQKLAIIVFVCIWVDLWYFQFPIDPGTCKEASSSLLLSGRKSFQLVIGIFPCVVQGQRPRHDTNRSQKQYHARFKYLSVASP